jgi:hypothetical protein
MGTPEAKKRDDSMGMVTLPLQFLQQPAITGVMFLAGDTDIAAEAVT